jgi:hypothetical protein
MVTHATIELLHRIDRSLTAGVSYSTESAVADGYLDADTREKNGWTGTAVAGDISAPDMAVIATKEALSRSRYRGEDSALILYGGSGIQRIPGWPAHHYVQRKAIGGNAAAVGVEAACNSTLLGLSLAAGYLSLLPGPRAALIAGADNWGSPEFDRYGYANGATDRGVGTRRRSECGHCLDRNRVRPGAVPGEREPSRVRGNVQASWAAVSAALRLCHGGRCRRAHPRFHSTSSHLLQVVRIHRDAGSVTERERRTLGVRHADCPSARGENQSSAGSIATFNSACQYSCRTEQRPSDPNRSVTQPDAVRGSRVAGS